MIDDKLLARYALLAYDDPATVREAVDVPIAIIATGGTEAYGFIHADVLVIAFRGTQLTSWADIKSDLRFHKTKADALGNAKVHSGFKAALSVVWDELKPLISTLGLPVIFCGHSLGGALAVVAAASCHALKLCEVAAVVTWGQPRVGDGAMVKILDGVPWRRYVRLADPVARVPLWTMRFRHGGNMYFIADDGVWRSPSGWTVMLKIWQAHGYGVARFAIASFGDHSISEYAARTP